MNEILYSWTIHRKPEHHTEHARNGRDFSDDEKCLLFLPSTDITPCTPRRPSYNNDSCNESQCSFIIWMRCGWSLLGKATLISWWRGQGPRPHADDCHGRPCKWYHYLHYNFSYISSYMIFFLSSYMLLLGFHWKLWVVWVVVLWVWFCRWCNGWCGLVVPPWQILLNLRIVTSSPMQLADDFTTDTHFLFRWVYSVYSVQCTGHNIQYCNVLYVRTVLGWRERRKQNKKPEHEKRESEWWVGLGEPVVLGNPTTVYTVYTVDTVPVPVVPSTKDSFFFA